MKKLLLCLLSAPIFAFGQLKIEKHEPAIGISSYNFDNQEVDLNSVKQNSGSTKYFIVYKDLTQPGLVYKSFSFGKKSDMIEFLRLVASCISKGDTLAHYTIMALDGKKIDFSYEVKEWSTLVTDKDKKYSVLEWPNGMAIHFLEDLKK